MCISIRLKSQTCRRDIFLPCENSNRRGFSSETLKCHDWREYDSNLRGSEDSFPCRVWQPRRKWRYVPLALSKTVFFLFLMVGVFWLGFEPNQCQATVVHSSDGIGQNYEKNGHQNNKPDVSRSRAPTAGTRNKHRRDR